MFEYLCGGGKEEENLWKENGFSNRTKNILINGVASQLSIDDLDDYRKNNYPFEHTIEFINTLRLDPREFTGFGPKSKEEFKSYIYKKYNVNIF